MTVLRTIALALVLCAPAVAAAQDTPQADTPRREDTRTQFPAFLTNSYFSFNVGSIGYLFTDRQLEPGFQVETIEKPRLAVRVDLFGHHFSKYVSAQGTYLRPARFVKYTNINGTTETRQVSNAYAGVTLVLRYPINDQVSVYGEGGGGVTSRSGFNINGRTALQAAHYTSGMLGAGFEFKTTPNIDLLLSLTYLPGRQSFEQPSSRFYTAGIRYQMRPVEPDKVVENRDAGYLFPENVIRLGGTTNLFGYGLNTLFSRKVPIFWGGHVETKRGATLDYQRNVFHTKKVFAFDLGASASIWSSNGSGDVFRTLSGYPMFRFFMARTDQADVYFNYSLAGPTFISRAIIDGQETGARFTFQDFMGIGAFIGPSRRVNVELGLKHFSNGNLFTTNASVKVPLTLTIGTTF